MLGAFPTRLLLDAEHVVEQFHPHWRALMVPSVLAVAGSGAAVAVAVSVDLPSWVPLALVVLAVLPLAAAAVRRLSVQYVLTSDRLIWRWGLLHRKGVEIPLEQINTVQYSQRLLARLLRYGDLEIESAGADGTSKFTDIPDPQRFQTTIYATRDGRKRNIYGTDQPR